MKINEGKIWDEVRHKWLVLTPEEWVRQHIVKYLTETLGVEHHRIGREVMLSPRQRADLVVYDRRGEPTMIIECKAQSVKISRETFEQVARYNRSLGWVRYLVVTNGVQMFCCEFDRESNSYHFLEAIPVV